MKCYKCFKSNISIKYTYDAAGIKLSKQVGSKITDYVGNFVYDENDNIKYIITNYGRLTPLSGGAGGGFSRHYNITDHLGNTRITFNDQNQVEQEDSYYPFGMSISDLSISTIADNEKNNYLYNGKELQTDEFNDFSLDWYDYGARFYDAQLGRWHVVDTMASDAPEWSPYRYGFNNPISITDPDGNFEDWWVTDKDGSLTHTWGDNEPVDPTGMTYIGEDGMFGEEGRYIEYGTYDTDEGETNISPDLSKELAEGAGFTQVEITETTTVTDTQLMPDADFTSLQTISNVVSENETKSITYMSNERANGVVGTSEALYGAPGDGDLTPWWSPAKIDRSTKITTSYNTPGTTVKSSDNIVKTIGIAFKIVKIVSNGISN